jgi:hypothetical protein
VKLWQLVFHVINTKYLPQWVDTCLERRQKEKEGNEITLNPFENGIMKCRAIRMRRELHKIYPPKANKI